MRAEGMAQVVEYLPSKPKALALSSTSGTMKKKKKKIWAEINEMQTKEPYKESVKQRVGFFWKDKRN
jgi:hypothetical protein